LTIPHSPFPIPGPARDTIAAIATAPGAGGVGVIRISGPLAPEIAQALIGRLPQPRHAHYAAFTDTDGSPLDHGIVLHFPAPRSYTGEDVVELQAHGSPPVLAGLLRRICMLGARPARAGEFTERAFLNGKLDLAQAEAVADLIAAGSEAAARAAMRSLEGAFSTAVESLRVALVRLRVHVEAAIDFPEEEIDFLGDGQIQASLTALTERHHQLLQEARRGQRLRDGLHVVIAGPPNAGKSSLLNALAGTERAIVTEIAGTTRDLLRETVQLDGIELTLVDTAGLREHSNDPIEREGMRRARSERSRADIVLAVIEAGDAEAEQTLRSELAAHRNPDHDAALHPTHVGADATTDSHHPTVFWLHNKIDLHSTAPRQQTIDNATHLWLSAATGAGLPALITQLREHAGLTDAGGAFSARARHVTALERTGEHLAIAARHLEHRSGELVAEELRLAQEQLAAITGQFGADELLGEIFGSFCIGK
jgi:tRNA modification GTPase